MGEAESQAENTRRAERRSSWAAGLSYVSTGTTPPRATRLAANTAPALPDGDKWRRIEAITRNKRFSKPTGPP